MAAIKETPRQKMIGILYLVLLGLVALSINTSVLDAFHNLTESLHNSTGNVEENVKNTYEAFEGSKLKDEPERARPAYEKAKKVSALAAQLDTYINGVEGELAKKGGGFKADGEIRNREDQDIAYRMMINNGKASEMKQQINATREKMLALLPEAQRKGLNLSLEATDPPTRGGIQKSWESVNFGDGIPLTAAFTNIAKIKADLKNTEFEVVKRVLGEVDKAVVNLDRFQAVAVAPSSYVVQGQPYTAEVFLTASDSKTDAEVTVNGNSLPVREGKGVYTGGTGSEGVFSWSGIVRVKQTDGTIKEYKTPLMTYQVARPSAVVSADKMNVLYIGVSNPISVSAPGIPKEKLKVSMSGGSLSGGGGKYTARVSSAGVARITVAAEVSPGKVQTLSSQEFRVKRIPDPRVKFGGKTGGSAPTVSLKQQNRIFPVLDNFDFDANFNINGFTLIIVKPRADAIVLSGSGNALNGAMTSAMQNITPGTRVIFDNIRATGPDGMQRQLDPVSLLAN